MAATGPKTFGGFYGNPANDPIGDEELRAIFHSWRATNSALTTEELLAEILLDFEKPVGSIAFFEKDPRSKSGVLKLLLGTKKHSEIGAHRGKVFSCSGNVTDGLDVHNVKFDKDQLQALAVTRCADTPASHQELLSQEPNEAMIASFSSTETQAVKMLTMRGGCFIPIFLTDLFLDKDLKARTAFDIAHQALQFENKLELCLPVLEFFMCTNALRSSSATREIPGTCHGRLGLADVFDAKVISHRRKKVLFDILPALKPTDGTAGSSAQLGQIATELSNLNTRASEEKMNGENAWEEAKAPKTATEAYREHTTEMLRRLNWANTDKDLPKVFHKFANAKKGHNIQASSPTGSPANWRHLMQISPPSCCLFFLRD